VGLDPGKSVCGGDPVEVKWFRNGELVRTLTYSGGGGNATVTFQSTTDIPSWLGPLSDAVLVATDEDTGAVYQSEVTCPDGSKHSLQSTIGDGSYGDAWDYAYYVGGSRVPSNPNSWFGPSYTIVPSIIEEALSETQSLFYVRLGNLGGLPVESLIGVAGPGGVTGCEVRVSP
jgi:hypothetical protein